MEYTCFENRELSWLRFNERVLEEAEDTRVPLCERLSFLSIFQSNLDEFFMVRIGSLHDQMLLDKDSRENKTNMTPGEQIDTALEWIRHLCHRRDAAYANLMGLLADQGITIVNFHSINPESAQYLEEMFRRDFMPLLSTFIVGKKQSFPFLANKEIYAIAVLSTKAEKRKIGIIPCASGLFPRLIAVPERTGCYILAEELILHCLPLMFPQYRIDGKALARLTRNADIDADSIYDEELNYRDHMAEVIKLRRKLCPVRMELSRAIEPAVIETLCDKFKLETKQVFEYDAPLDMSFLFKIQDELRNHSELFYAPRHPQKSPDLDLNRSILEQIAKKDVLLHYPYQSIRPFLQMLSEAARDPKVVSIKMTLYRLARDSKVVESLVEAAENGKQVDVLVELKARFDEENNIGWARVLEQAGCHVIYGLPALKVHCKALLVVRRENGTLRRYMHWGTGNYNDATARIYTDMGLFTASDQLGEDATELFNLITGYSRPPRFQRLHVAPKGLRSFLYERIDAEIRHAREGRPARIAAKVNSLLDPGIIERLYEASQAGVKVDLVVRGICAIRPGLPGISDNIRVVSIVGRYLEHHRIFYFFDGGRNRVYLSSADWMPRNLDRRVETCFPIDDPSLREQVRCTLEAALADNQKAREMDAEGNCRRVRSPGQPPLDFQKWCYAQLQHGTEAEAARTEPSAVPEAAEAAAQRESGEVSPPQPFPEAGLAQEPAMEPAALDEEGRRRLDAFFREATWTMKDSGDDLLEDDPPLPRPDK